MMFRKNKQADDTESASPAQDTFSAANSRQRMGELLLNAGVIKQDQLQAALDKQIATGHFLGRILVEDGHLTQDALTSCLVKQCKIPLINLLDYQVSDDLLGLLSEELCREYGVLPIDKLGRILTVAMLDPLDIEALEKVRDACPDLKIKPILCEWRAFDQVTGKLFRSDEDAEEDVSMASFGLSTSPSSKPKAAPKAEPAPAPEPELPDDTEIVSAESFGLSALPSRPTVKPTPPKEEAPAPAAPARPAPAASAASAAPTALPGMSADELAGAISRSVTEALRSTAAPPPPPAMTADELAGAISKSMAEVLRNTAPPAMAASAAPTSMPAISAEELAGAISKSVTEALRDTASAVAGQMRQAERQDAPGLDPAEVAALMREGMRDAMREALETVAARQDATAPGPTLSPGELFEGMRDSLRDAMREAVATVAVSGRPSGEGGPSPTELAQLLQGSLREAMKDAVADMGRVMQTAREEGQETGAAAVEAIAVQVKEAAAATIAEQMRAAAALNANEHAGALEAAREALHSIRDNHEANEARLTQLTEAALQAAQSAQAAVQAVMAAQESQSMRMIEAAQEAREAALKAQEEATRAANEVEAAVVAGQNRRELARGAAGRKRREAAAILGKAESDVLEAIEGPGVKLRADERIRAALDSESPLRGYTFDTFVVGRANEFTIKLAQAISKSPGGEYNPFFLYGEVGIGKTHLVNAIGNAVTAADPDADVCYVSASRFARRLSDAIEEHTLDAFRESYCQWDLLVFDDIQFLGGRVEAQEEFFHIFNTLHQEGRQIVIAGDRPPDKLGQLEKRLVSRFGSGVVASLQPPDWETRMAILARQAKASDKPVSQEILNLIASKTPGDIRKMTGSLRKVIAFSELVDRDITPDLVAEILSHLGFDDAA